MLRLGFEGRQYIWEMISNTRRTREWDRKAKEATRRCVDKQVTAGGHRNSVLLGTSKMWSRTGYRVVLPRKKEAGIEAMLQLVSIISCGWLLGFSFCWSSGVQASSWGQGNMSGESQVCAARGSATTSYIALQFESLWTLGKPRVRPSLLCWITSINPPKLRSPALLSQSWEWLQHPLGIRFMVLHSALWLLYILLILLLTVFLLNSPTSLEGQSPHPY